MNYRQDYTDTLFNKARALIEEVAQPVEWPELPEGGTISNFNYPLIIYPLDLGLMDRVRQAFKDQGWRLSHQWDGEEVQSPEYSYEKGGYYVSVAFYPWKDGATCKRVKKGTVTREEPVYDYECIEG